MSSSFGDIYWIPDNDYPYICDIENRNVLACGISIGFRCNYFGKNSMVSFLLGSLWLIEISYALAHTNSDHIF